MRLSAKSPKRETVRREVSFAWPLRVQHAVAKGLLRHVPDFCPGAFLAMTELGLAPEDETFRSYPLSVRARSLLTVHFFQNLPQLTLGPVQLRLRC